MPKGMVELRKFVDTHSHIVFGADDGAQSLKEAIDLLNLARWMAKERLISFIGSDMHGTRPGKHKPRLKEGIQWLYENTDEEYADAVCFGNAAKLLGTE